MTFMHTLWVNSGKSKSENQNHDTIHFPNAIYRVLHEGTNITVSFAEHLKLQGKLWLLHMHFGLIVVYEN